MTTVASLVANPILLRNNHQKLTAVKLSATCNSRHAPKFNGARVKCFFSAADLTNTTTNDSKNSGRHASLCKRPHAIKDHLGIGKPLGRVGGKWSSAYPYDAQSPNPSDSPCSYGSALMVSWRNKCCQASGWFFSGKGRDIQMDLNRIAETADTSTYKGLSYVLTETIVALLRHHEYYTSSSVSVVSKFSREAANTYVDQLSTDERVNNKEILVNVNDMKMQSSTSQGSANDWHNDDRMVTLFVGAKGGHELPTIYDKYDLKNVLQRLIFIGSSNHITAVEVSWIPQSSCCSAATSVKIHHL
ncbi:hypothetical protein M0R45_021486 [Rubus argutus]|uniref:Uncharacterized protein n=1 Tax=Rubus argutus TaxID=59490 RepID=A0AAW1XD49_RUBAR